jgi:hypothetical protein
MHKILTLDDEGRKNFTALSRWRLKFMWRSITRVQCLYLAFYFENSILKWSTTFIHSATCITTSHYLLPKQFLHRVPSSDSVFNFQYPFFTWSSSSSCLHLLPLLSFTSTHLSNFPLCFKRQFVRQRWVIQFFSLHVAYTSLPWVCLTLLHFSHDRSSWSFRPYRSPYFQTFQAFVICFSKKKA